jgi:hypothetical protein
MGYSLSALQTNQSRLLGGVWLSGAYTRPVFYRGKLRKRFRFRSFIGDYN